MGYHVSIVRRKGRDIKPISKQEWDKFVKKSSLLSFEKWEDGKTYAVFKDKEQSMLVRLRDSGQECRKKFALLPKSIKKYNQRI